MIALSKGKKYLFLVPAVMVLFGALLYGQAWLLNGLMNNTLVRRLFSHSSKQVMTTFTNDSTNPFPLPRLDFSLNPQQLAEQVDQAIRDYRQTVDELLNSNDTSFDGVMKRLALQDAQFGMACAAPGFLQHVSMDGEVRKASVEASKVLDRFSIEMGTHEGLFTLTKRVSASLQPGELDPESARLLEKTLLGYRRMGLELSPADRERFKALRERLAVLSTDFSEAMAEDRTHLLLTREQLAGCSEDYLASLEYRDAEHVYVVTMKYPDVFGALRMAKSAETRRLVDVTFNSRCRENLDRLEEAIKVRGEAARLLGYPTHAHFQLEEALAKTPENVAQFEADLKAKLVPMGHADLAKLAKYKAAETGESNPVIHSWDTGSYTRQLLEQEYNVDQEKIKEYFPLEHVVKEMLKIYEEVLGLRFEALSTAPSWHADVQTFAVWDRATGAPVGHFYLDLFPRDGKYTHAACFPLQPGHTDAQGHRIYPANAIVANFSKPLPDKPSLLKHDEVETLFHELGHAMHGMCAVTRYSRFHGTNVETDFVEAPSQMLENWVWDRASLKRLSSHYRDGQPLPDSLIDQLISSRHVNSGVAYLRQIFFGLFDMAIHSIGEAGLKEPIAELYERLRAEVTLVPQPAGVYPAATFGHMMGGYDAGYYGYLWSEVFAADMFATRFSAEGLQNPATGMAYRRSILLPGGSRDGMTSVIEFLGRKPNQKAFLESIGVKEA